MIKLKVLLLLAIVLIMIGCAATDFSYAWPYIQMRPEKVRKFTPKNYSDCIAAIDTVLTPVVKQHFKNQDSTIAVIEICNEIGGFFILNLLQQLNVYYFNNKLLININNKIALKNCPICPKASICALSEKDSAIY